MTFDPMAHLVSQNELGSPVIEEVLVGSCFEESRPPTGLIQAPGGRCGLGQDVHVVRRDGM